MLLFYGGNGSEFLMRGLTYQNSCFVLRLDNIVHVMYIFNWCIHLGDTYLQFNGFLQYFDDNFNEISENL